MAKFKLQGYVKLSS